MRAQAQICMICHDDHSMPGTDSEGRSYGRLCKFDDMLVRITTLEAENAELRRRVEAAEVQLRIEKPDRRAFIIEDAQHREIGVLCADTSEEAARIAGVPETQLNTIYHGDQMVRLHAAGEEER